MRHTAPEAPTRRRPSLHAGNTQPAWNPGEGLKFCSALCFFRSFLLFFFIFSDKSGKAQNSQFVEFYCNWLQSEKKKEHRIFLFTNITEQQFKLKNYDRSRNQQRTHRNENGWRFFWLSFGNGSRERENSLRKNKWKLRKQSTKRKHFRWCPWRNLD